MSFTPGEGSEKASITAAIGSGITVGTISGVDYVSANLVAGSGVSLVPSTTDTSITISSTGGGGGIASVTSANGSGITATTVGSGVTLTSALVAGTDIGLTPSSVTKALTVNNLQTTSTATGCGISAVKTGSDTALAANLTAGNGISITSSGVNTSKQVSNTGVLSLTAGAGVTLSQTTGNITISASTSGFVPYTGATQDLDLGSRGLFTSSPLSIGGFNVVDQSISTTTWSGLVINKQLSVPGGAGSPQTVNLINFTSAPNGFYSVMFNSGEGNGGLIYIRKSPGGMTLYGGSFSGNAGYGIPSIYGGTAQTGVNFNGYILRYEYANHFQDGYGFVVATFLFGGYT
jgi:hypothetical protein